MTLVTCTSPHIEKLDKYKQSLTLIRPAHEEADSPNRDVYSYTTRVATIDMAAGELVEFGWWSQTTQKHINYVAEYYELSIVRDSQWKKHNKETKGKGRAQ